MNQYGKDNHNKYKYENKTTKTGKQLKDPVDSNHQMATYGRLCSSQEVFENKNFCEPNASLNGVRWLTTSEAAQYLRVSISGIKSMIFRGQIRVHKLGRRNRFLRDELDRLIRSPNSN